MSTRFANTEIPVGVLMAHTFSFHWKDLGHKWNFKKVVQFSRWKFSGEKACSIYEFSQGITSSRLFTAISVPTYGTCVKWNTFFTRRTFQ